MKKVIFSLYDFFNRRGFNEGDDEAFGFLMLDTVIRNLNEYVQDFYAIRFYQHNIVGHNSCRICARNLNTDLYDEDAYNYALELILRAGLSEYKFLERAKLVMLNNARHIKFQPPQATI